MCIRDSFSTVRKWRDTTEPMMAELIRRGYDGTVTCEFCTDSLPADDEQFDRAKALAGMKADIAWLRKLAGR